MADIVITRTLQPVTGSGLLRQIRTLIRLVQSEQPELQGCQLRDIGIIRQRGSLIVKLYWQQPEICSEQTKQPAADCLKTM